MCSFLKAFLVLIRQKLLQLWLFQIRSLFVEFVITMETNEKTFSTLDVCWG